MTNDCAKYPSGPNKVYGITVDRKEVNYNSKNECNSKPVPVKRKAITTMQDIKFFI